MKKMSVRKIGAVLGAALVASSAFGAVSFENTELVSNNGQVVAKVVVGSKAQPSDGVAAAKIASYLASRAFSQRQVSAELEGQAVCTVSNATGDARCEVVNKSVDLTIIMPGLRSNQVVTMNPLIGETLDTELGDRDAPPGAPSSSSDTLNVLTKLWDDYAHPDQNQIGTPGLFGISSLNNYDAYVIDYRNYDGFKIHTVTGRAISNVQEKQRVYVKGYTYYDDHQVKFRLQDLVYSVVFGPDDYGLPLCPGDVQKDWSVCEVSKRLESARAQIKFMGQNWYVTKVDIPVQTTGQPSQNSEVYTVSGAEIHLAREATYGIINVGESLQTEDGQYRVVLDDISKNDQANNPAIISVLDRNNNTLVQDQIRPGETKTLQLGGGKTIKVHVYQTAPGFTLLAKWAELAILKDSIVLRHGDDFLDDQNTVYTVGLGFVHRRATSLTSSSEFTATNLKEIVLYATNINENMKKGDKYYLTDVQGYKMYELSYDGLNDPGFNNVNLRYSTSSLTGTFADGSSNFNVNEYVEVTLSEPVRFNNNLDDGSGTWISGEARTFYYVTSGSGSGSFGPGDLLVRYENKWYFVDNPGLLSLPYRPLGNLNGGIEFTDSSPYTISLIEDTGRVVNQEESGTIIVEADLGGNKLLSVGGNDDEVTYSYTSSPLNYFNSYGYGVSAGSDYQTLFITPRGTEVSGTGAVRTVKVSREVRRAQLFFKATDMGTVEPESVQLKNLVEGETRDVPGTDIKVRVDKINVETRLVGTVSGGVATPDLSNVRAVIRDGTTRTTSMMVATPAYTTGYPDVVVLDNSPEASAGTVILVGGPVVNSKTADVLQGTQNPLSATNRVLVREVAQGKIVVAGWEAADTLQAVEQFLAQLRSS
ncbi:MAG: hypothetical protein QXD03_02965 [Candidatus Anstonellales archaeon]